MGTTFGESEFSSLETTAAFAHTDIYGLLPTFTIDVAQDVTSAFKVTEENHTGTLIDDAPITVEPGGTVMLISYGPLAIDAPITVKGAGLADLRWDEGQTLSGGTVDPSAFSLGDGASMTSETSAGGVATTSQGGQLDLNTVPFTLVYTMAQLDAIDGINGATGASETVYGPGEGGNYALVDDLNAGGTTYGPSVVNLFTGTFDGLGHIISNVTINYTATSNNTAVGFFGSLEGTLRNLNLSDLSLTVTETTVQGAMVGGLVGTTHNLLLSSGNNN